MRNSFADPYPGRGTPLATSPLTTSPLVTATPPPPSPLPPFATPPSPLHPSPLPPSPLHPSPLRPSALTPWPLPRSPLRPSPSRRRCHRQETGSGTPRRDGGPRSVRGNLSLLSHWSPGDKDTGTYEVRPLLSLLYPRTPRSVQSTYLSPLQVVQEKDDGPYRPEDSSCGVGPLRSSLSPGPVSTVSLPARTDSFRGKVLPARPSSLRVRPSNPECMD